MINTIKNGFETFDVVSGEAFVARDGDFMVFRPATAERIIFHFEQDGIYRIFRAKDKDGATTYWATGPFGKMPIVWEAFR